MSDTTSVRPKGSANSAVIDVSSDSYSHNYNLSFRFDKATVATELKIAAAGEKLYAATKHKEETPSNKVKHRASLDRFTKLLSSVGLLTLHTDSIEYSILVEQ